MEATATPPHCAGASTWPCVKMSRSTEKTLRVVVTVVVTRGSKLARVKKIADWPTALQAANLVT